MMSAHLCLGKYANIELHASQKPVSVLTVYLVLKLFVLQICCQVSQSQQ